MCLIANGLPAQEADSQAVAAAGMNQLGAGDHAAAS